jgi:protein CsiD
MGTPILQYEMHMNTAATLLRRTSDLPFVSRLPDYEIAVHPHHARLYHITIAKPLLREFFAAVHNVDTQNLQYVPFARFALADQLAKLIGGRFVPTLKGILTDRESGGFTIGLQGVSDSPDDYVKFGTALAYLAGPANFDSMSGTYYARFVVTHTDTSDSYLRQAYRLFTLHTDGTFVSDATDWLLMMKFAEHHAKGGESRLLHLDDWEELERFSTDALATHPFTYTSPPSKNVSETTQRPTFFLDEGRPCICFIDQFVQPRTRDQAQYLQALSDSMERSAGTVALPLPVGDLVMLNNLFWLHGRAPFEPHPELHRELLRIRGSFARE